MLYPTNKYVKIEMVKRDFYLTGGKKTLFSIFEMTVSEAQHM